MRTTSRLFKVCSDRPACCRPSHSSSTRSPSHKTKRFPRAAAHHHTSPSLSHRASDRSPLACLCNLTSSAASLSNAIHVRGPSDHEATGGAFQLRLPCLWPSTGTQKIYQRHHCSRHPVFVSLTPSPRQSGTLSSTTPLPVPHQVHRLVLRDVLPSHPLISTDHRHHGLLTDVPPAFARHLLS